MPRLGISGFPLQSKQSAIRLGSRACFTIDYQDYRIAGAIPLGTTSNVAGYR